MARPSESGAARRALASLPWLAAGGMLAAGWGKRPDVLHDFGREVYLAWRVSSGDVLYRDLAHFNGPLSVWANAAVLSIPGAGIATLLAANVLVLLAGLALLDRLLRRCASPLARSAGATAFVVLCGTAHLIGIGGFDFVAPYSHEATHGSVLALAALVLIARVREKPSAGRALVAGALVGLVFLTKVEIALAAGLCVLATLAAGPAAAAATGWRSALAAGVAAPVAVAGSVLSLSLGPGGAFEALARPWSALVSGRLSAEPFYRTVTGTADLAGNIGRLAAVGAAELGLVALGVVLARGLGGRGPRTRRAGAGLVLASSAAAFGASLGVMREFPELLFDLFRPLPVVAGLGLILAWRRRAPTEAIVCLFSLAVVLKIAGRCGVHHYGFFLAAPALVAAVVLLLDAVPASVRLEGRARALYRALACSVLAAVAVASVDRSLRVWRLKDVRVEAVRPVDSFWADSRARSVNAALRELRAVVSPGETLSCLPEGTLLNYLLRTRNPSPNFVVLPPEVLLFGREAVVESYRRAPADWVVLHGRRLEEYGVSTLGGDFLPELGAHLAAAYRPAVLVGRDPRIVGGGGVLILRRSGAP